MSLKNNAYKDFFRELINLILIKIYLEKINQEKSVDFFWKTHFYQQNFFEEKKCLPKNLQ